MILQLISFVYTFYLTKNFSSITSSHEIYEK